MTEPSNVVKVKLPDVDAALYRAGRLTGLAEGEADKVKAAELKRQAMDEMRRAMSLGAGQPRERTLRHRLRDAMMGAFHGWKGAPWPDDS